jgi:two-component system, response regulator YesN
LFKVLIVDDEVLIREGLKNVITWEEHGFYICGEAVNGRDGLEKVFALNPDLIIADIRMPVIGGMEMIGYLRESGNNCRVILLTGYSEFEYAKKAIDLQVDQYLLKPFDDMDLIDALNIVRNKLVSSEKENIYTEVMDLALDKVLEKIVLGELNEIHLETYNRLYSLALPWKSYQIILIEFEDTLSRDFNNKSRILYNVKRFVSENSYGFSFDIEGYICILIKDTVFSKANILPIQVLRSLIKKSCDVDVVIYIGKVVEHINKIETSFESARHLSNKEFSVGEERIILYESCKGSREVNEKDTDVLINKISGKLYIAVDSAQVNYVDRALEEFKLMIGVSNLRQQNIKNIYLKLYTAIVSELRRSYEDILKNIASERDTISDILRANHLQEIEEALKSFLHKACECVEGKKSDTIMKRILDYICNNYNKEIKLATLSEVFGYNSIYLGKLFKKYTGQSFNSYLDKLRIENSKRLLKEGNKVYDVAEQVGYCHKDYFYSKFKKYVGMSPIEYKKSL